MRYRAFISYSHADRAWAAWLHRRLESYRVPKRLVGAEGLYGAVPTRLTPIFRDRDELSSAADLSESIKEALADSESLILICSPDSARSAWVNEEIHFFRSLGRGHRIHCVIVAGNPQSDDADTSCFPEAVLEGDGEDTSEPLAADVRKWADGKTLAMLKVAAGVLGIRLDELRQRERQRKRRLQALMALVILAASALLLFTFQSRLAEKQARLARQAQQASAESMLARFLEQSERLSDVADLETRKAFGQVMSTYLSELDSADLTSESRRQLGVVLLNRGVILRDEGQMEGAMDVFRSARQILQSLVQDSQGDAAALFELSQVEFWIGQVNLDLGHMQEAAVSFQAYRNASAALHRLEPDNADWTMEVAYAQSNLGNLEARKIPSDPQLVLQYFRAALQYNEMAARQDDNYASELAESHAYLADAWLGVCDMENATRGRLKSVELAEKFFSLNPGSNRLKQDYAYSLTGLARVQQMGGRVEAAIESLARAIELQRSLLDADPNNMEKHWNLLRISALQAQYVSWAGNGNESRRLSQSVLVEMEEMADRYPDMDLNQSIVYGRFLRNLAHHSFQQGDTEYADSLLRQSIDRLAGIVDEHSESKRALNEFFLSYFLYWDHNRAALPDLAPDHRLNRLRYALTDSGCEDLDLAARLAAIEGREREARQNASRLIGKGYLEPGFMEFCLKHSLCERSGL